MSTIDHAKREFLKLGYKPIEECEDDPDKWVQENVLELLEVFVNQGHSGSSASYVINLFEKLAKQEPVAPILCTDDEWVDVGSYGSKDEMLFQNIRCSAVFKKGEDNTPYYLDAIVWRDQNNNTFTGRVKNHKNEEIRSSQNIKLPFTPKTFYIDVISTEVQKDDWEHQIKDESQLKQVWNYYEKPETLSDKRLKKLKQINEYE
jgi:hypothetical protein